MFLRNDTVKLNIGGVEIGGGSRISVQSMTNTDTRDAKSTIDQIKRLEEVGCDIVRVAVPDMQAAESILTIKSQSIYLREFYEYLGNGTVEKILL